MLKLNVMFQPLMVLEIRGPLIGLLAFLTLQNGSPFGMTIREMKALVFISSLKAMFRVTYGRD